MPGLAGHRCQCNAGRALRPASRSNIGAGLGCSVSSRLRAAWGSCRAAADDVTGATAQVPRLTTGRPGTAVTSGHSHMRTWMLCWSRRLDSAEAVNIGAGGPSGRITVAAHGPGAAMTRLRSRGGRRTRSRLLMIWIQLFFQVLL